MVGCRYNAKNTLDKNYLWFAENMFGASILAETEVIKIEHIDGEYRVYTQQSTVWFGKKESDFHIFRACSRVAVC
jgi:cholesterol oxidase